MDPLAIVSHWVQSVQNCSQPTHHFCIKLPSTHRTISDRNHSISADGSYPLVAFPKYQVLSVSSPQERSMQQALTFRICSSAHVHHMNQGIRMTQIIQELIPQTASLVCSWNKTRDIQKFNGYRSPSFEAASVVWFALVRNVESLACAFYLKVTNGALRINRGETRRGGLETI